MAQVRRPYAEGGAAPLRRRSESTIRSSRSLGPATWLWATSPADRPDEVYERCWRSEALATAGKLGDYFIATDAVYDKPENIVRKPGGYWLNFETYYLSVSRGSCLGSRERRQALPG